MGLKENVIIGKLIPAGTGMQRYHRVDIEEAREEAPVLDVVSAIAGGGSYE